MDPESPENTLVLREYETRRVRLDRQTAQALHAASRGHLSLAFDPEPGYYQVSATSYVGTVAVEDLQVLIRPKVHLENLFALLDVGIPDSSWASADFPFGISSSLLSAVAAYFTRRIETTLEQGVLRSYKPEGERLWTIRGRIDISESLRRPGLDVPIPVRYEEFTADIPENRYLRSAIRRLTRTPGVTPRTRTQLNRQLGWLEEVSDAEVDIELLRRLNFSRLNEYYRPALMLAEVVLRNLTLIDAPGGAKASSFLLDMNDLFQRFATNKLAAALTGRLETLGEPTYRLGATNEVVMQPDLVFRQRGEDVYVADVKYKILKRGPGRSSDYYQLLSYLTSMSLKEGLLIYCQAEGDLPPRALKVRNSEKTIYTYPVNLQGSPADLFSAFSALAEWIASRALRASADLELAQ